jgi:hypothetical protein
MTEEAINKIDALLEEALSTKMKTAGAAGLAGMLGAGLDVYFNGGQHLKDFIKPLAAWGIGGALGGALQPGDNENPKKNKTAS